MILSSTAIFSYNAGENNSLDILFLFLSAVMVSFLVKINRALNGEEDETIHKDGQAYSLPKFVKNYDYADTLKAFVSSDIVNVYQQWARDTPDPVFQIKLKTPYTMVAVSNDTQLTRTILNDKSALKDDISKEVLKKFHDGGECIVTSDGPFWTHSRKGMASAFASGHIRRMNKVAMAKMEDFVENKLEHYAATGKSFDVGEAMIDITFSAICEAAYEYDMSPEEKKSFIEDRDVIRAQINSCKSPKRWKFVSTLSALFTLFASTNAETKRVDEALKGLVAFGFRILESYRSKESPQEGTVIDLIANNRHYKDDKHRVNDILMVLYAGFGTTAYSLTWILLELAKNQSEQAKLRDELKSLKPEERLKSSALANVIKETMRLRPVAPVISRHVTRDIIVHTAKKKNSLEKDICIPKNSIVIMPFIAKNRDSNIFEDPDNFKPSRWINPSKEACDTLMPFGLGSRNCIGQPLAKAEIQNALAKFCAEYNFTVDKEGIFKYDAFYYSAGTCLFVSKA